MDYQNKYLKYKFKYSKLKNQTGGYISNVTSAVFYNNEIYLIQEQSGEWNLPGGEINPGEDHRTASVREFIEETGGFDLDKFTSNLSNEYRKKFIKEFVYHRHTKIFLYYLEVYSKKPEIKFIKTKDNDETIDGKWFNIFDLPSPIKYPDSMSRVILKYINDK